ncbi:MAG: NAD(P)H-binding protein [Myxococcales bacterium]|nr:NAD(P)H-binding protein [Myxococcales bacterium]MCB9577745.1 NAD(P)H-binding protein [Polyangiaceae bacterium]
MKTAFVGGATGYTGREVVRQLAEQGVRVVAHVRPDSGRLAEWRERFSAMGAEVSTAAWELGAMTEELTRLCPEVVFALLGTTKKRGATTGDSYESVDYGLSALLLKAAEGSGVAPLFVYLSAAGVSDTAKGGYYGARARVEGLLRDSALSSVIARPSFITGPDRDESRPGERIGATVSDALLTTLSWVGARRLKERYRSTSNVELARALVRAAPTPNEKMLILESEDLRS